MKEMNCPACRRRLVVEEVGENEFYNIECLSLWFMAEHVIRVIAFGPTGLIVGVRVPRQGVE